MKRTLLWLLIFLAASGSYSANAQLSKDGKNRRVIVLNERTSDMMRLYASRISTSDWEENILTQPVKAGKGIRVDFDDGTGACLFDFRAVFRDGLQAHMWKFNVCREVYWRVAD